MSESPFFQSILQKIDFQIDLEIDIRQVMKWLHLFNFATIAIVDLKEIANNKTKYMIRLKMPIVVLAILLSVFISCKKNDKDNLARNIKFEITGEFTGKVSVTYTNNLGNAITVNDVQLPWSTEIRYYVNIREISIAANGTVSGNPGQTVTTSIYQNGQTIKQTVLISDRSGSITIPLLTHIF